MNTQDMNKKIEIPEGYEARIEGNKVIIEPKEDKDEKIRKELVYFIQKEKEYMESKVKPENSPKLMFLINALAYLEKQKEQKPAEEDKTNGWTGVDLGRFLSCLQRLGSGNPLQPETINSKWFKEHCRPQPHWKPSEEQMKALKVVARGFPTDDPDAIDSLLTDLQKLL